MLAPAFAVVLTWAIQGQGNTTILIPNWTRITVESSGAVYGAGFGQSVQAFFEKFLFKSMYLTTPIAIVLLIAVSVLIYKTRLGLRLRACGEHPQAADSVGINVYKMRYIGVCISGFLAGIGGLAFTVAAGSGFQSTVAGYGFLALGGNDLRQLEAPEHSGRFCVLRLFQDDPDPTAPPFPSCPASKG